MSSVQTESDEIELAPIEEEAPRPVETFESPAALQLRFALVQDQLKAAAAKVNLLHGMGLERTAGYAEAFAIYEAKLADFNAMKARFGV